MSPIESYMYQPTIPGAYFENVAAATGSVPGIYSLTRNIGTRTSGVLKGASINVEPLAGYDCYGIIGAEVCTYASTGTASASVIGMFVETQGLSTAITGDWYSLWVYSAPGIAPSGSSAVVRLEHNSAVTTEAFIAFVNSSTCPTYALNFGPVQDTTAWNGSGASKSGAGGWIKCKVGTATRYINFYTT